MSIAAQSYPHPRGFEVPPNVTDGHPSSTGVESGVESRNSLHIGGISSTVSTHCRAADTLLCSPLGRAGEEWYGGVERPIELTAESLWNEVAGRLKGALNETTYRTWFAEAEGAELSDDAFVLGVPNDFTREWIEGHFLDLIRAAVNDAGGRERVVTVSVAVGDAPEEEQPPPLRERLDGSGNMNAKYVFDSFVIG